MYSHVIREWFERINTRGVRSTVSLMKHDVHRGLYFLYLRPRLSTLSTNNTDEIKKIWIDPNEIQWVSTAPRSMLPRYGNEGVVGTLNGSWDRFRIPVKETETFHRLEEAYHNNENHELLSSIEDGYREADIDSDEMRTIRGVEIPDEIRLAVGRNGEFMRWSGGLHRLSAAQLIGVDRIPAYIVLWHTDVNQKHIIMKYGNKSGGNKPL